LFGRKSRAEKLRQESPSLLSGATLAAALDGARPFAERLFSDDDLRDNIRTFLESARKVLDELSDEDPTDIVARLWDDDKLRREVETAIEALQEGTKRIRGQRVRKRGGSGKILLVLVLGGVGFLFFSPRTGPQARKMAGDVLSSLRPGS
jgi:hypothetical protein